MNWEMVHAASAIIVAAVGLANFVVMLMIKKEIAEAIGAVKEWARSEFVSQREADVRFRSLDERA